jgi:hypothetical protein
MGSSENFLFSKLNHFIALVYHNYLFILEPILIGFIGFYTSAQYWLCQKLVGAHPSLRSSNATANEVSHEG